MMNRWCTRLLAAFAVVAGVMMSTAPEAKACTGLQATCWCAIATGGWNSGVKAKYDLGCRKPSTTRPRECSKNCSDKVSGNIGLLGGATAACAGNGWASACLRGYGYIGATGTNNADGTVGRITCTPPKAAVTQTTCKCPPGTKGDNWVDGGVVTGGKKCTYVICDNMKPFAGTSLPPNGTAVNGAWGYTWGHFIGQNINPTCTTTVISPAVPGSGTHTPGC